MHSPDTAEFRRFWTEDRIDRSFPVNSQRMMIGVAVPPTWDRLSASLLVASGRGKFLQVRHCEEELEWLPEALATRLQKSSADPRTGLDEWLQLIQDLADCQTPLVLRLAGLAGKYVDRILGITVLDPGFLRTDFDGAAMFAAGCDPARLAERTGMSVLDDLAARDLAAAGNGQSLEALPLWFLFADRHPRGARHSILLALVGEQSRWYFLPGSDGLDEVVPEIASAPLLNPGGRPESVWAGTLVQQALLERPDQLPVGEILLASTGPEWDDPVGVLERDLGERLPGIPVRIASACGNSRPECLMARVAALAGLLFTDQMPLNIPGLTGAAGLRLLGRLTPGKPFSFRNLLASMADSQSAPMRLRDAV